MKPSKSPILKVIRSIKTDLKSVSSTEVAKLLGYSRHNLYKHLNKGKDANPDQVSRIVDAVAKAKKESAKKTAAQIHSLEKKIAI